MKVLVVISDLNSKGGVVRSAINMTNSLDSKMNYKITLLSVFKSDNKEMFYSPNKNIKIKYLDLDINFQGNKIQKQRYFYRNLRCVAQNYDCIISTNAHFNIYFAIMKKLGLVARVLGCEHGAYNHLGYGWRKLTKFTYKYLDQLVLLTSKEKEKYEKFSKKVVVIYNIKYTKEPKQELMKNYDEKRILLVGRIDNNKNYKEMINAFSKMNKKYLDWHVDIVGDGEKEDVLLLQKLINDNKLDNQVHLLGAHKNVEQFYEKSAMLVMTSKSEGLPMVLIEAMSYKLPCISYDIKTGPSEIIENSKNGFLINYDENRIKNLAEKIEELIENKDLRKNMSEYACKTISKFDEDKIIPLWICAIGGNNE